MLQLVLVSTSMNRNLALIHTQSLATTAILTSPPDDDMDCLVDIVFSHCVVAFDIETQ